MFTEVQQAVQEQQMKTLIEEFREFKESNQKDHEILFQKLDSMSDFPTVKKAVFAFIGAVGLAFVAGLVTLIWK